MSAMLCLATAITRPVWTKHPVGEAQLFW